jgi:hypothetical protein
MNEAYRLVVRHGKTSKKQTKLPYPPHVLEFLKKLGTCIVRPWESLAAKGLVRLTSDCKKKMQARMGLKNFDCAHVFTSSRSILRPNGQNFRLRERISRPKGRKLTSWQTSKLRKCRHLTPKERFVSGGNCPISDIKVGKVFLAIW